MIKKNWKWFAGGLVLVILLVAGFLAWRVLTFVDHTFQDKPRVSTLVSPTPDAEVTATAQARVGGVVISSTPIVPTVGNAVTANPVTAVVGTAATAAPTPFMYDPNLPLLQRIRNGQRITLLYMGYSGPGHDGPYLTDTVMVMSFDPKTSTVSEFSIPRDLYVPFPIGPGGTNSWGKVNGVFSTVMKWEEPTQDKVDQKYRWTDDKSQLNSAANLLTDTVERIMGIPIDIWVAMDFTGFRKLIEAMDGVNVCVERTFTDKHYPRNDNDQVDASEMTIHFEAGCQKMDGETAIRFSRSRKSEDLQEGGDFARSLRQMKVVEAIKQKATSGNLFFKFLDILGALDNNIHTSLTFDQARGLLGYIQSDDGKKLQQQIKFDSEVMSGVNGLVTDFKDPVLDYVLYPTAGKGNFKKIQQWVQEDFAHLPIRREQVWVQVINSSNNVGAEDRLSDYLIGLGYHVSGPEKASPIDSCTLYDYTNGTVPDNVALLQKMLPGLKIITATPDKKPYPTAPGLILYLGKNYNGVLDVTGSN